MSPEHYKELQKARLEIPENYKNIELCCHKAKRIRMVVLSEDEISAINFCIHTSWGEMTEEEKIDASKALDKLNRAMESVGGDI